MQTIFLIQILFATFYYLSDEFEDTLAEAKKKPSMQVLSSDDEQKPLMEKTLKRRKRKRKRIVAMSGNKVLIS